VQVAHQVGAAAVAAPAPAPAAALTAGKHAVPVTAMSMYLCSRWKGIRARCAVVHSRPTVRGCARHRVDKSVRVWSMEDGTCVATLEGHFNGGVFQAVFTPDGASILSASEDGTAKTWNCAHVMVPATRPLRDSGTGSSWQCGARWWPPAPTHVSHAIVTCIAVAITLVALAAAVWSLFRGATTPCSFIRPCTLFDCQQARAGSKHSVARLIHDEDDEEFKVTFFLLFTALHEERLQHWHTQRNTHTTQHTHTRTTVLCLCSVFCVVVVVGVLCVFFCVSPVTPHCSTPFGAAHPAWEWHRAAPTP